MVSEPRMRQQGFLVLSVLDLISKGGWIHLMLFSSVTECAHLSLEALLGRIIEDGLYQCADVDSQSGLLKAGTDSPASPICVLPPARALVVVEEVTQCVTVCVLAHRWSVLARCLAVDAGLCCGRRNTGRPFGALYTPRSEITFCFTNSIRKEWTRVPPSNQILTFVATK